MKKSHTLNKSLTDWEQLDAMENEDIDLSDIPEITPDMFDTAIVRRSSQPAHEKEQLTLEVDNDVLNWFRSQGQGYRTKINLLLRNYMETHQA